MVIHLCYYSNKESKCFQVDIVRKDEVKIIYIRGGNTMPKQIIENLIDEVLTRETQKKSNRVRCIFKI